MRFALVMILTFLPSVAAANEVNPSAVDSRLSTVVSTGVSRFLEYRLCSTEHCYSFSYLQWLDHESLDRDLLATVEVPELSLGVWVDSARWVKGEGMPQLEVRVIPFLEEEKPHILVVKLGSPGNYTVSRKK